jgi:hypothetical protein
MLKLVVSRAGIDVRNRRPWQLGAELCSCGARVKMVAKRDISLHRILKLTTVSVSLNFPFSIIMPVLLSFFYIFFLHSTLLLIFHTSYLFIYLFVVYLTTLLQNLHCIA